MKIQMTIRALFPIGLLLLCLAPLSAQDSLPNPRDASCWESLATLHACALQQYNRAMAEAERCTSYPEYQCMPEPGPNAAELEAAKASAKAKRLKTSAREKSAPASDTITKSDPAQAPGSN